jgi:AraC family transcriptional regulator
MDAPMDYVAGVLVGADVATPEGFEAIDFPAGTYFTFTHRGPVTELGASYPRAYGEEFPKAGREMRPAPHLEIYESDKDPMDPNYEMIIAIPVL